MTTLCNIVGDAVWEESAAVMFARSSEDGATVNRVDISTYTYLHLSIHIYTYPQVTWADVLDFYIRLDQERSKATVFQPLHHDGDFKAAQHSR